MITVILKNGDEEYFSQSTLSTSVKKVTVTDLTVINFIGLYLENYHY